MQKHLPFLIIAGVLVAALVGGALFLKTRRSGDTLSSVPPRPTPIAQPSKLADDVVVRVEEFGDYQCPPCAELHPALKSLKQEFGANLSFIFRNLPLSTIHKNALAAAQAAEAARVQNHFWEMHDLLYENQDLWKDDPSPRPRFVKFARDIGLDTARFIRDLDGEQVRFRIEADMDAAVRLGIDGTPTILINGRRLRPEATTVEGIRKGIEVMMARTGSHEP